MTQNNVPYSSKNNKAYLRAIKDLLNEYPFGPSNLYTGSSLELVSLDGRQFLIHADHSGDLKINKLVVSPSENYAGALIHSLNRASEVSVRDKHFSKYSRIFGIAKSDANHVVGLKYWEGAAVAKLKHSEDDSSISAEVIARRDLARKSCCDISFLDCLESFLVVDSNGSLTLTDFNSDQLVNCWTNNFCRQVALN